MKPFLKIGGCQSYDLGGGVFQVVGLGQIDSDGTGPHHGDKTPSNHTSYKPDLNADVVPYVTTPPQFRASQQTDVVLGCEVFVENLLNGKSTLAVCGDVSPPTKWGEMSVECARRVGLDPSPVSGGTNYQHIRYTYHTGKAAVIDGRTFKLEPA